MFRLVVDKNGKSVRTVEIRTPAARIGRAHGNDVRIPSADVSRRHCHLQMENGLLRVEDLESVNGTYLNGDLVTGEAVIRPGDRLEVGPVMFVVEYELTPEALERLREMNYEIVAGGADAATAADAEADEPTNEVRKPKPRKKSREDEDLVPLEEEVLEVEEYEPRDDLEEVTWAPPEDGDLRDVLAHLDEGAESMQPRKRPQPRTRPKEDDRSAKPKKGKRRPKAGE